MAPSEKIKVIGVKIYPPFLKSFGTYKIPVATKPLKMVKQVAMGPSFLTYFAYASIILRCDVSGDSPSTPALISLLASSRSAIPYLVLSIKLLGVMHYFGLIFHALFASLLVARIRS